MDVNNFNYYEYINNYKDLRFLKHNEAYRHYLNHGKKEGRIYNTNNLHDFNPKIYKKLNTDLQDKTYEEALLHYIRFGKYEGRQYKLQDFNTDRLQDFTINKLQYINMDILQELNMNEFNNFALIFICHNNESFNMIENYLKYNNCYVIIVGDDINLINIYKYSNEKIIIAKNYKNNIEYEKKLLTFTAWYLIVKNNLFVNFTHLCVLEYDVYFKDETIFKQIDILTKTNDIISFYGDKIHFQTDINIDVLKKYMEIKNINFIHYNDPNLFWYHSTNHCISRNIIEKFVDWYYPDCLIIKLYDYKMLSYYHERLFSIFIIENNYKIYLLQNSLIHYQRVSHFNFNKHIQKKILLTYDDGTRNYNEHTYNLILSVNMYSDFLIKIFSKNNIDITFKNIYNYILSQQRGDGYWLWKPYIILTYLNKLNENDILFYIDSKYYFVENFDDLYNDKLLKTDIIVWKNKPNEEITYLKNYCKMDIIKKYNMEDLIFNKSAECCWAGAIIIKKNDNTVNIIKEWLSMCCDGNDITDSNSIMPNSELFIDHRHDQSLLSIVLHKYDIPFYYFEKKYLQNSRVPW